MHRVRLTIILAALVAAPAVAFAADGPTAPTTATGQLVAVVASILLAVLVPIAGVLGARLAARLKASTGLDLTKQITAITEQAIGYAEQLSTKNADRLGAKLPGAAKLDLALAYIAPIAEAQGWPAWARSKATEFVEAHLGKSPMMSAFATLDTTDKPAAAAAVAVSS